MTCSECGAAVPPGTRFCGACGHRLETETPETPETPSPTSAPPPSPPAEPAGIPVQVSAALTAPTVPLAATAPTAPAAPAAPTFPQPGAAAAPPTAPPVPPGAAAQPAAAQLPAWLPVDARVGGLVLAAALAASAMMLLLLAIGLALLGDPLSTSSSSSSGSARSSGGGSDGGLATLLATWIQVAGLALGGAVSIGGPAAASAAGGSGTVTFLPALGTVAVLVACYLLTRRYAPRDATVGQAARDAAVTAAVPILALMIATAVFPIRSDGFSLTTSAVALLLLGFPLLFLTGMVARGRRSSAAWGPAAPVMQSPALRRAGAAVLAHLAVTGALLFVVIVIALLVKVGVVRMLGWLFTAPFTAGAALAAGEGLSHGGSVSIEWNAAWLHDDQSVSLFSGGVSGWALLLLLVAVAGSVLAGVRVGGGMPGGWHRQWTDVWVTPAAFFVLWLVVFLLVGRASATGSLTGIPLMGSVTGDAVAQVASVSALLMAAWGLLVEACARFVALPLIARYPALPALLRVRAWDPAAAAPAGAAPAIAASAPSAASATTSAPPATPSPAASPLAAPPSPSFGLAPAVGGASPEPVVPPAPPLTGTPSLTPRQRERVKLVSIVVGGLAVIALAATLVIHWLSSAFFGPGPLVQDYLNALASGNATAATAMVDPGIPNSQRAALTDAVLQGASARIDGVRVSDPTEDGDRVSVPVEFSVDGQRVSTAVTAERDGTSWLVFPTWRLTSGLAQPVSVSSPAGLNVSGTDIAPAPSPGASSGSGSASTDLSDAELYFYPGVYTVTGATDRATATWLSASTQKLTVGEPQVSSRSSAATVAITVDASPALTAEVSKQLHSFIDTCAATGQARPTVNGATCPFSTYNPDGKTEWKVTSYPEITVSARSDGEGLQVQTTTSGKVVSTTTTPGYLGGSTTSTDTQSIDTYSVKASIGADGAVHVTP